MNRYMSRTEFDALPDRQGFAGVPVYGAEFRDSAYPDTVFRAASKDWERYPDWHAFAVRFDG